MGGRGGGPVLAAGPQRPQGAGLGQRLLPRLPARATGPRRVTAGTSGSQPLFRTAALRVLRQRRLPFRLPAAAVGRARVARAAAAGALGKDGGCRERAGEAGGRARGERGRGGGGRSSRAVWLGGWSCHLEPYEGGAGGGPGLPVPATGGVQGLRLFAGRKDVGLSAGGKSETLVAGAPRVGVTVDGLLWDPSGGALWRRGCHSVSRGLGSASPGYASIEETRRGQLSRGHGGHRSAQRQRAGGGQLAGRPLSATGAVQAGASARGPCVAEGPGVRLPRLLAGAAVTGGRRGGRRELSRGAPCPAAAPLVAGSN